MRLHGEFGALALWTYGDAERRIARPEHLAVIRFELVERDAVATGWLDLVFESPAARTLVCGVYVELTAAGRDDDGALIFPQAAHALLDDGAAAALTAFVVPRVRLLMRGRVVPLEEVVRLAPSPAFERARAAGELGAAPLAVALPRVARWLGAVRAAGGGPVAIRSVEIDLGSAVAARLGSPLTAGSTPASGDWYAAAARVDAEPVASVADDLAAAPAAAVRTVFAEPAAESGAVRCLPAIAPLPVDVVFSSDPADGPVCAAAWAVTAAPAMPPAERTPLAVPAGLPALAFVVRADFHSAPDADTDEVGELLERLIAAGADASIVVGPVAFAPGLRVIPVLWGALTDAHVVATAQRLAQERRPYAVVAAPDSPYAAWFEAAIYTVAKSAADEERLEHFLRAFDQRRLDIGNPPLTAPPSERDVTPLARALGGRTFVSVAATDGASQAAERLAVPGLQAMAFAPVVPASRGEDGGALALTGGRPFAFVHGPGGLASNLAAVLLALRDLAIPLVVATSYTDYAYAATMRRIAGAHATILTDADPACIDALYRHATVFIDPALRSRGLSRVVRAARGGAVPVVFAEAAAARLLPPECTVARSGIVDLRDAVRRVWHAPGRDAIGRRVRSALGDTLGSEASVAGAAQQLVDAVSALAGAAVP